VAVKYFFDEAELKEVEPPRRKERKEKSNSGKKQLSPKTLRVLCAFAVHALFFFTAIMGTFLIFNRFWGVDVPIPVLSPSQG